jgi:site-specific recombinase XerD
MSELLLDAAGCRRSRATVRFHAGRPPRNKGVRRRPAPHELRRAHAVEMAHEGVPLIVIQRQLGHSNLGITSIYLRGIDNAEIIGAVHARRAHDRRQHDAPHVALVARMPQPGRPRCSSGSSGTARRR